MAKKYKRKRTYKKRRMVKIKHTSLGWRMDDKKKSQQKWEIYYRKNKKMSL